MIKIKYTKTGILASVNIYNITSPIIAQTIPKNTIVVILLVGSNIFLHYFAGPHKNIDPPIVSPIPKLYNIMNLIIGLLLFESLLIKALIMPAFMKPIIDPKTRQIAKP